MFSDKLYDSLCDSLLKTEIKVGNFVCLYDINDSAVEFSNIL